MPATAAWTTSRSRAADQSGSTAPRSRNDGRKIATSAIAAPGDPVRRRLPDRTEIGREREERPGHGLGGAVAGQERLLGDPARLDDGVVQERQHDVAAAEHERARPVEARRQVEGVGRAEVGGERQADEQRDEADGRGDRGAAADREPHRQRQRAHRAAERDRADRPGREDRRRPGPERPARAAPRRRRPTASSSRAGPRASVRAIAITAAATTAAAASSSPCTQPAPARSTSARPDRERRQDHGRGQREAEPGRQAAELAGAVDADRDPDLARGRAGQQVRERHQLAELLLAEPAAAGDVLLAEVADVRHGAAERGQPEAERDAEHLARRSRDGRVPVL